jgi:uncharacterized membrane protein
MTKTVKWLGIGLVVSLGLNLFVLGAWVGKIARHGNTVETERVTLGPMTESLSPEGRQLVRQSIRTNRKEAIPIFKELNAARERANQALETDPFDPAAYEAALRDIRAYSEAGQALLHTTLVDVVSRLSMDDRRRLAEESRRLSSRRSLVRSQFSGPPRDRDAPPPEQGPPPGAEGR